MIQIPIVCPYCRYVRKLDLTEEEIRGAKRVVICCFICGNLYPLPASLEPCTTPG